MSEYIVMLSVVTDTRDHAVELMAGLSALTPGLVKHGSVSLSCHTDVDGAELFEDEEETLRPLHQETMFKVSTTLREAGHADNEIDHIVGSLQDAGILFRERATD